MEDERKESNSSKIQVVRLIEILQDEIENASKVPFSSKVMIDRKVITDLIDDIIQTLPEDFNTAQYIISEKDRILDEANNEYNRIKAEADEIMKTQVNEHKIVKTAEEKAREIVSKAQTEAKNMRLAAKDYADGLLTDLENEIQQKSGQAMTDFKKTVEDFVSGYRDSVDKTTQTVRENIQELRNIK